MITKNRLTLTLSLFILLSCNFSKSKIDDETYTTYLEKGDEITNLAQATLLGNVSKAIQKGGPEFAVEFCNLNASVLADSLSQINNCIISRVSVKNRNPGNNLKSKQEKELWQKMQLKLSVDTLIQNSQSLLYYKSIKIALPACLKCHGDTEHDINTSTLEKINKLYPNDLATGYSLNDFRGMWKVEFKIN